MENSFPNCRDFYSCQYLLYIYIRMVPSQEETIFSSSCMSVFLVLELTSSQQRISEQIKEFQNRYGSK